MVCIHFLPGAGELRLHGGKGIYRRGHGAAISHLGFNRRYFLFQPFQRSAVGHHRMVEAGALLRNFEEPVVGEGISRSDLLQQIGRLEDPAFPKLGLGLLAFRAGSVQVLVRFQNVVVNGAIGLGVFRIARLECQDGMGEFLAYAFEQVAVGRDLPGDTIRFFSMLGHRLVVGFQRGGAHVEDMVELRDGAGDFIEGVFGIIHTAATEFRQSLLGQFLGAGNAQRRVEVQRAIGTLERVSQGQFRVQL